MSWLKKKKKIAFKFRLVLFNASANHFFIGLCRATKSGFSTTTSDDQLSGCTEVKLQSTSHSQTSIKKRSRSLFGGLLPVWSATAFSIPAKTITSEKYAQQINEMHQKLQRLQQALVHRKGLILHDITLCFISWINWATKLCLICHIHLTSHQQTTAFSSISTTFFGGKRFHNQQEAENAFKEFVESWSMYFYITGINKLISHLQQCIDCNGSYFDE